MVKKGDFLRIEYTGYDEGGNVFDSTSGEIAKQLHGKDGSMLVVFGVDYLVPGMSEAILSMKKGEEREFSVSPEKGFGHRNQHLLKILSLKDFYDKEIEPYPGAVIEMDTGEGTFNGLVKSVNSGRVQMDFNHPLADQTVKYKLKLTDLIESQDGKFSELVKDLQLDATFAISDGKAMVTIKKGLKDAEVKKAQLKIAVKSTIPEIKDVEFKEE